MQAFKQRNTLKINYKSKNIAQVLDMTVEEALSFFENIPRIKTPAPELLMWVWVISGSPACHNTFRR